MISNRYIVLAVLVTLFSRNVTSQDSAKKRLIDSPRHHEWVTVKQDSRNVECFVVYPEVKEKVPAVLVIHENRGLTDWVRSVADQLAEAGYIAIAPDLLSGMAPGGGKTNDFPDQDAARDAIYKLAPEQVMKDLKAAGDYGMQLPACNGKLVVAGFCWGGSQAFNFAAHAKNLSASFVFYGTASDNPEDFKTIQCPVYGFYGENDARVNSTVPATAENMKAADKVFEPVTYTGAGHGFMRSGEDAAPDSADKKARDEAWKRWLDLLGKI